ncbi:MAG: hypothetical protein ACRDZ3_09980, partial [Acidimicrobiia bacterium]
MSEFDQDTAFRPGPSGLAGHISDRWDIAGRPNGGYLMAALVGFRSPGAGLAAGVTGLSAVAGVAADELPFGGQRRVELARA